jgi:hypothetical protein
MRFTLPAWTRSSMSRTGCSLGAEDPSIDGGLHPPDISSRLFRYWHLRWPLLSLLHLLLTSVLLLAVATTSEEENARESLLSLEFPPPPLLLILLLATDGLTLECTHMCSRKPNMACFGRYRVFRSSFTTCESCECVRDA